MLLNTEVRGITAVTRRLEDITEDLESKMNELCRNLADIAADEAEMQYDSSPYEDEDLVGVSVSPVDGEIAHVVRAEGVSAIDKDGQVVGNAVAFAEFGAGLLAGSHPWSTHISGVYPGSWSESHGTGEYAATGKWHYDGEVYVYKEPTYALYFGMEKAKNELVKEAKEVFG